MRSTIIFFCPRLDSGGAEMHLARLIRELPNERYRKILVLVRSGGGYEELIPESVEIIHLFDNRIRSSTLSMIQAVRPLGSILKVHQPSLVYSIMDHTNIACYFAWKFAGNPGKLIFSVQTSLQNAVKFAPRNPFFRLVRMLTKIYYPRADMIICLSEGVRSELNNYIPTTKDLTVVINNYGLDKIEGEYSRAESAVLTITACGRLIKLKGFDVLIGAMAKVKSSVKNVRLKIMGVGPEETNLRSMVDNLGLSGYVDFLGFVKDPSKVFASSDIFVLSSHYEGFGNVIVEAMASGCAVISTDCPYGPGEIIKSGHNGILVPVNDVDSMADAIVSLCSDDAMRQDLIQNARIRAKDFLPSRITRLHEEAFNSISGLS